MLFTNIFDFNLYLLTLSLDLFLFLIYNKIEYTLIRNRV